MVVNPAVIERHLDQELPFMATENLLMAAVQAGGDRQDLHERIRVHAMATAAGIKVGLENDLIERIRSDPAFPPVDMVDVLDPGRYIGRSIRQVEEFLAREVEPIRRRYPDQPAEDPDERVRV
jgi:adenylosuccinate lyase